MVDSSLSYGAEHEYGFKDQDPGSLTQKLCAVAAKQDPLCFGKTHSNFLTCSDLKPKSICIRLAVCQCRPGFQAPPVLGKLNWQFSILFRSEGHAADSRKNKKHKQKNTQIRQAGSGARGPWLQRYRLVAPPGESPEAILSSHVLPEKTGSERSRQL